MCSMQLCESIEHLRKRLVACCDGTFCSSDKGKENYATNITRLCRIIANTGLDESKQPITQLVNYQSGVGTGWLTPLNRDLQGRQTALVDAQLLLTRRHGSLG